MISLVRYTTKNDDGSYDYDKHIVGEAMDLLGGYEDTGLTPDEIVKLNTFEKTQCAKLLEENCKLKKEVECWKRESISDKSKLGLLRMWLSDNDFDMDDILHKIGEQVK